MSVQPPNKPACKHKPGEACTCELREQLDEERDRAAASLTRNTTAAERFLEADADSKRFRLHKKARK